MNSRRLISALLTAVFLSGGSLLMAAPVPPEIKQVVAFIFVPGNRGQLVANGTGFFVGVKDTSDPQRHHVYFVTARHVLTREPGGPFFTEIFVRLNKKDGEGSELARLPLTTSGSAKTVYVHPDPTVDLAVVPALPDQNTIEFKFLPDDLITTQAAFAELKISEGSDVFFTGLFTPHVGEQRNYPIVRFGRVALVTAEKINWRGQKMDLYLMESSSYGGNSGSPVFFYLGSDRQPGSLVLGPPELRLAGVMMGAFQDIQPIGVVEQQASVPVSVANMGIAAVIPAYKLHEILFGEELTQKRNSK